MSTRNGIPVPYGWKLEKDCGAYLRLRRADGATSTFSPKDLKACRGCWEPLTYVHPGISRCRVCGQDYDSVTGQTINRPPA